MPRLTLSLLGAFHAELDGQPVVGFESNKSRALLAYLAVEADSPHARESLATLLWPETTTTTALTYLRNALADLRLNLNDRQAEIPFLLATREAIQVNPKADIWVDVRQFEIQQSTINNLQSAIALYRDPFLSGFSIPDSAPFEEWLTLQRERLGQQAIQLLRRVADIHEACGEYTSALDDARRQVELEPWLEEAHRQIMRVLALSGQRSAALAQYETCKRLLADELGIPPADETTRLYQVILEGREEEIRRGELLPAPGQPPFKGLQYFDEPDAPLFFGRQALTDRLVEQVEKMVSVAVGAGLETKSDQADHPSTDLPLPAPILAIVGPSGSGKSSLVRAGLVPRLRQQGWQAMVITPTAHPMEMLRAGEKGLWDQGAGDQGSKKLLVIDQFEELFTLCRSEEERREFLDCLLTPPQPLPIETPPMERGMPPSPTVTFGWGGAGGGVVLALRADFYNSCAQYPHLRQALAARQEYIGPMTASELRQAIEQPALRNGWQFEEGLIDLFLRDVGATEGNTPEPGALPLLEHALLETWQRRRGRKLTLNGYHEAGGVHGAIAKTAESVFGRLSPEQQALARSIFLRLTELGEGAQDTRRRAPLSELTSSAQATSQVTGLLKLLADARLITLAEDSAEVAHEALIREWPALRAWLSEDRDGLRLHHRLAESAAEWERLGRDPGELYRGARLAQALEWAADHPQALNALESEFLQAGKAESERQAVEREAQRQRELEAARKLAETERQRAEVQSQAAADQAQSARRLRRRAWQLTGVLAIALLLTVIAIFLAQQSNRNAQRALTNLNKSEAQRIAAEANRLLIEGENAEAAALLALRSLNMQYTPQGDEALSRASRYSYPRLIFRGHTSAVRGVAFTGDGKKVVTNGADDIVLLWDAATGDILQTYQGENGIGYAVAISADGRYVAGSTSTSNTVVWDGISGRQIISMTHRVVVTDTNGISVTVAEGITLTTPSVALSADGRYLLTGHKDGSARMWAVPGGKEVQRFPGHPSFVHATAFSPDGRYVATSDGTDNTVRVWDASTGKILHTFPKHTAWVDGLAFSPDGKLFLSTSQDKYACLWNLENGQLIRCMLHETLIGFNAAFSPDGRFFLTGTDDGVAHLWDVATGTEVHRYQQSQWIAGVAFSPDGNTVATTSMDGTAYLWATEPRLVQEQFTGMPTYSYFSYLPDGQSIIAASDSNVRILDIATHQERMLNLNGWGGYNSFVIYASNGTSILSVCCNTKMITLDAKTEITQALFAMQSIILYADLSPDGKTVGMMYYNNRAYLFDARSGDQLYEFPKDSIGQKFKYNLALGFSADSDRIGIGASVDQKAKILVFSLPDRQNVLTLDLPNDLVVTGVAFSPDGSLILGAGAPDTNELLLWDARSGKKLQEFIGHNGVLWSVAFSPDGRFVAAAGDDAAARMWDIATGREIRRFQGHTAGINDIHFSPDGKWLASAGNDGALKLWRVDLEALKADLCAALPRDLTDEERAQYGITDPGPTCPKFSQAGSGKP